MNAEQVLEEVRSLLKELAAALVSDPGLVQVNSEPLEGGGYRLTLTVGPRDHGKVLGRGGRIARSLRIVLQGISHQQNVHFVLNIPGSHEATPSVELVDDAMRL